MQNSIHSTKEQPAFRFNIRFLLLATALVAIALVLTAPMRSFLPWFYYEEFNGVRNRLEAVEGLEIKSHWQHQDMTLEDCGFSVAVDGIEVSLTFFDHQDWVGLFEETEGIVYEDESGQKYLTRDQLQRDGLNIEGLSDVLENLDAVVEICETSSGIEYNREAQNQSGEFNFKRWANIRKAQQ